MFLLVSNVDQSSGPEYPVNYELIYTSVIDLRHAFDIFHKMYEINTGRTCWGGGGVSCYVLSL